MTWTQVYAPVVSEVVSACIAAIPLVILLYMLAVKRAKGHVAALAGLASAFLIAIFVWGMPVVTAASAVSLGVANGLFPIIWIVITAVWVYNMTVESGEFEIIKDSLARVTPDRRLQTIFIAFAFGAFLEGTAGSVPPWPSLPPCLPALASIRCMELASASSPILLLWPLALSVPPS